MKARRSMGWITAMGIFPALICMAVSASAAVLVETDFTNWASKIQRKGGIALPEGRGWKSGLPYVKGGDDDPSGRLVIDLKTLGADFKRGTFDFVVVRDDRETEECLLAVKDAQGADSFHINLVWEAIFSSIGPMVALRGLEEETWSMFYKDLWPGMGAWAPAFPLRASKGMPVRITLTWGENAADNAVYINGQKLPTRSPKDFDFGAFLRQSSEIVIGAHQSGDKYGKHYNRLNSVLKEFRMLDRPTLEREENPAVSIASLEHDADTAAGFSGKLVAGDKVTVAMTATPGAAATVDLARVADRDGTIKMSWKGFGVYLDPDKVFFGDGEIDLRDVREYRLYASPEPLPEITKDTEPLATLRPERQHYIIKDLQPGTPYYVVVAALMKGGGIRSVIVPRSGVSLLEDSRKPGSYQGTITIEYADDCPQAALIGRVKSGSSAAKLVAEDNLDIETELSIAVAAAPVELKADEKSTAKITVTVTDANGDAVIGHKIKFVLATTSRYTGVIGGGKFADEVGGVLKDDFWGETDLFGKVTATYTAGFAAKTAIIVARDMVSNSTGAAFIKTFINAAAELELEGAQVASAKALGYLLAVTSSDDWLTADGRSTARITALLTKDGRPVEGHSINFSVSSGAGSIKTVANVTDRDGKARAVYTAGKKIGMVVVSAKDPAVGIAGAVQIELRSDAPAKIKIKINPEKLPADGSSRADLLVLVTDINDNPNEGAAVEYDITTGGGRISKADKETDNRGEAEAVYIAGRTPGRVTIEVTVRSAAPSPDELDKARDLALLPIDYDFF